MKISTLKAFWPCFFFSLVTIVVLVLPILGIIFWNGIMSRIGEELDSNCATFSSLVMSNVDQTAELLRSLTPMAANLAQTCSSSVSGNGTELSFYDIETKVAPLMFQALSLVPLVSEVSYVGVDGLFFSYLTEGNQTYSLYANSSLSNNLTWYKQLVNPHTRDRYGDAFKYRALNAVNASWFHDAFTSADGSSASLEQGWNSDQDLMLLTSARVGVIGVVSLGFAVKDLISMFSTVNLQNGNLFLVSDDGRVLLQGIPNIQLSLSNNSIYFRVMSLQGEVVQAANVSCQPNDGKPRSSTSVSFLGKKYMLFCSPVQIMGKQMVYVFDIQANRFSRLHNKMQLVHLFLVILILALLLAIVCSTCITIRAARREMYLCSKLIEQMEATRQAETKSMSKSTAFAGASHDIRASLAGIIGLIDMCYSEVLPGSDFEKNLKLMDGSAKDLLDLLNSVLDTSKIEVGKMLLEEEEFNLAQLLEDIVDSYHAVAMKKDVDVVLDPCDGSINKYSFVQGDRVKLRQILSNLLSNAVKFTPEGHITVRAWAKKPSFESSILADNQGGWRKKLAGLFHGDRGKSGEKEQDKAFSRNPNAMEFAFEVDDTGKGIPKDKQKLVFENYIQVKETVHGLGGTGLGLGIVQSLVRLMGGDIKIVDKEMGEKGTCFWFNVFLEVLNNNDSSERTREADIELGCPSSIRDMRLPSITIRRTGSGQTIHSSSSRFSYSPRAEGSHVILLISDEERRLVSQSFMERFGIRVLTAKEWEDLHLILKNTKRKFKLSGDSSSGKSDGSFKSEQNMSKSSGSGSKNVPLTAMDGTDQILPAYRRGNVRGFLLLVIDTSAGPFPQLLQLVSQFRRVLRGGCCRVVWLDKPYKRSINRRVLDEGWLDPTDVVLSQPFHGSRLLEVIKILPEFAGSSSGKRRDAGALHIREVPSLSVQEIRTPSMEKPPTGRKVVDSEIAGPSMTKPLSGKTVLLAEDNDVLAFTARAVLVQLGVTFHRCKNGEEAVGEICEGLRKGELGRGPTLPYDFILMDCEMPVMDGYEATRRIREVEKDYSAYIPIIALTAHSSGAETRKMYEAGMDFHLEKPLRRNPLLEILHRLKVA